MIEVTDAGIDTWSPCWYVGEDSPAERAMDALATQPTRRGRLIPGDVDGHRVGWIPGSRLVYAEGHPVANGLGGGGGLQERCDAIAASIRDLGVPLPTARARRSSETVGLDERPGLAGVRRLDCTVDLRCETAELGAAVMAGIAAVNPPRLDRALWFDGQGLATVYWRGGRRVMGRVYDKGLESGDAPRNTHLRLEAQYAWAREHRRDPEELSAGYVAGKWAGRFAPLWQSENGIKVVGQMAMRDDLREAIARGDLTFAQAEQVLGFQLLTAGTGREGLANERTARRRRALIRESGYVLADGAALEEVQVNLHELLQEACGSEAWGRNS